MKVLFVANGFPPRGQWGTEFYTAQLASALARRGHELAAFVPDRDGERPRYTLEEAATPLARLFVLHNTGDRGKRFAPSYRDGEVDRRFGELLDRWKPDLVHFTYLLWGLSVGLVGEVARRGLPSVATLTDYGLLCHRGQMFDWRLLPCGGPHPPDVCARCVRRRSRHDSGAAARLGHALLADGLAALGGLGRVPTTADLADRERAVGEALAQLDVLIAPTESLARVFRRAGVPAERIETLVYALDQAPFEVARAQPPAEPVVFGYFGQFAPQKGLHVLLDAVRLASARLPESVEPWSLRLYGAPAGGRHRLYPKHLFEPDPGPRVDVRGSFPIGASPRVLADLHALVVPSLWDENAPLTCLEARAAGVPVIASDVPGIRAVIEPGRDGLLVPPGDPQALADAMREFVLHRFPRRVPAGLPMELEAHTDVVEALYARARTARAARPGAPRP